VSLGENGAIALLGREASLQRRNDQAESTDGKTKLSKEFEK